MLIERLRVGHFRCLQNCAIKLSDFTALVGPNGVGKSTLLESLRYLFVPKYQLTIEDINPNCTTTPIEVSVRFYGLNEREKTIYGNLVVDGAMEVTKRSVHTAEDDAWVYQYEIDDFAHPAFDDIRGVRETSGAVPAKNAYSTFAKAHPPYRLEPVTTIATAEDNMRQWEITNADQCVRHAVRFDFSPKGGVSLADCTQLIHIPAVREAKNEIEGARSPLQELL